MRGEPKYEVDGRGGEEPFDEPEFDPDELPEFWDEADTDPDGDWAPVEDEPLTSGGRWCLQVSESPSGDIRVELGSTVAQQGDADADRSWARYMNAIGRVLADEQSAAVVAPSPTAAFMALQPTSQTHLMKSVAHQLPGAAERPTVDSSQLSRARRTLVACRWGTVPLEFFWWNARSKVSLEVRVTASQSLLDAVAANPDASDNKIKDSVGKGDWIRKEVPAARELLDKWPFVLRLRSTPESWSQDTLDKLLRRQPGRGELLVRLAVVGLIDRHGR